MCSLVMTMSSTTIQLLVNRSIIRGLHGPYNPHMVTIGRCLLLSLRYNQFSMCHFGLFLLIVNLVMSKFFLHYASLLPLVMCTLPKFTQSMC